MGGGVRKECFLMGWALSRLQVINRLINMVGFRVINRFGLTSVINNT
jgi:hypothetical protein